MEKSALLKGRIELVKAMNTIITCINDEDAYMEWIYIVPDQATEDDFEFIAEDDEEFEDAVRAFGIICKEYLGSGLYIDGDLYPCR